MSSGTSRVGSAARLVAKLFLCLVVVVCWVTVIYWNELVSAGVFGARSDGPAGVAPEGWGLAAYSPALALASLLLHRTLMVTVVAGGQVALSVSIELSIGHSLDTNTVLAALSVLVIVAAAAYSFSTTEQRQRFGFPRLFGALVGAGFSVFALGPPDTLLWMLVVVLCAWECRQTWSSKPQLAIALIVGVAVLAASFGAVAPVGS